MCSSLWKKCMWWNCWLPTQHPSFSLLLERIQFYLDICLFLFNPCNLHEDDSTWRVGPEKSRPVVLIPSPLPGMQNLKFKSSIQHFSLETGLSPVVGSWPKLAQEVLSREHLFLSWLKIYSSLSFSLLSLPFFSLPFVSFPFPFLPFPSTPLSLTHTHRCQNEISSCVN